MSLGKARAACSSSVQVAPRSSDRRSTGPQWLLTDPVNSRVSAERVSMHVAYTSSPAKVGPDTSQPSEPATERRVNSPLVVPTSTMVLVGVSVEVAVDGLSSVMTGQTSPALRTHRAANDLDVAIVGGELPSSIRRPDAAGVEVTA